MLKLLPSINLFPATGIKCGEIFCYNSKDFTIVCTFCQMKSFQYDGFLQHLQDVHLENHVAKIEEHNYLEVDVKKENIKYEEDEITIWDNMEQPSYSDENEQDIESSEEEKLVILKKAERKKRSTKRKSPKRSQDKKYNESSSDGPEVQKIKSSGNKVVSLSNSKRNDKEIEYSCPECSAKYPQKKILDKHVLELHNGYKCSICDKRFRRRGHLKDHLKIHNTEKKFICPVENCGRGFIDQDYLRRHLEVHTMERTFVCDFENCGKAFQTSRRLASHKYTHPKKFVCDMCGRRCRSKTELETHQRTHTGEKPFPCEVCSKPFISKTALKEHMISHLETRPHVCPVCNAAFANRRVLVRHSFIHSDEKTFKCKLCESAFKHPNSLQGHMRNVHREQKLEVAK